MLPLPFPKSTISLGYGAVDGIYYTRQSPHQGTDFSSRSQGVTSGSVIRASGPGTVVRQGVGPAGVSPSMGRPNSKSGNSIDVDYGNVVVRYMHRPYNSPSPATGARVAEGTELGVIGNTGLSGGPHLHMEAWDKRTRTRVDPARFFDFNRTVTTGSTSGGGSIPFPTTPVEEDDMFSNEDRQALQALLGDRAASGGVQYYERTWGPQEWMIVDPTFGPLPEDPKQDGYRITIDPAKARVWGRQYSGRDTVPVHVDRAEYIAAQEWGRERAQEHRATQALILRAAFPNGTAPATSEK